MEDQISSAFTFHRSTSPAEGVGLVCDAFLAHVQNGFSVDLGHLFYLTCLSH